MKLDVKFQESNSEFKMDFGSVYNLSGGGGTSYGVQYIPQDLTDEQQTQARQNIGAVSMEEAETQVRGFAQAAAKSASDAAVIAQEVRNERAGAKAYAENAKQYAQNSYNYMEIANKCSMDAGTKAANAELYASHASTHATNAKSEREYADKSATNAANFASSASQSEKNARTYRNEAYEFAQQAATSGGAVKTVNGQKPDENGNIEVVAGTQGDWNQNDPEALDYIKNRTHYIFSGALLDSQADSYTHDTFGKMWVISKAPQLTVGESYTVNYNGTDYVCVCQSAPGGLTADPNAVAMGNFSVVGGANTGEPFAMLVSNLFNRVDIIDLSGANDVWVKIFGTVLRKLSPMYLPDGVPYLGGINYILPERQPTRDEDGQTFDLSGMASLVAGESYTVNWNGVDYSCVAQMLDTNGVKVVVLGNLGDILGGESSGEPFVIMSTGTESLALALDGSTDLTISIRQGEESRKLPVELLPDGLTGSLTTAQISALDGMFRIVAYTQNASAAYAAFKVAFGIEDSGDVPDVPDVPDEPEVHTHSYTSTVTKAETCETAGVRTYTCSCGHSYTEAIPATGHNYADGTCTNCGAADPDYDVGGDEPETTEPVYQLAEATTFNADHVVDTGYKLLDKEKSWSVCIDCTDSSKGGTVWDASTAPVQGLALSDRSGSIRTLIVAGSLYKTIADALGDYKIIVTHTKNTDLIEYHYVLPGSSQLVSGEITYTKYLTDTNIINSNPKTLKLGGNSNGEPSYRGIVHRFEIYERVLGEDEIYEFTNAEVQGEIVYVVPPCVIPTDNIVTGYVGNNGVLTALADNYTGNTFIKVNSGSSYTVDATELFNISALNKTFRYAWYDNSGVFVSRSSVGFSTTKKVATITAPATAEYMVVGLGYSGLTEGNVAEMFAKVTISEVTA